MLRLGRGAACFESLMRLYPASCFVRLTSTKPGQLPLRRILYIPFPFPRSTSSSFCVSAFNLDDIDLIAHQHHLTFGSSCFYCTTSEITISREQRKSKHSKNCLLMRPPPTCETHATHSCPARLSSPNTTAPSPSAFNITRPSAGPC
jgi:hypothetical protein